MTAVSQEQSLDRERPDPEELLDRYQLRDVLPTDSTSAATGEEVGSASGERAAPRRGRLRIYLGMAAGVGKTYAMLGEGHRRKSRGTDIVIGYVETHGRRLTEAQIGDLEVIPRKHITYRGVTLEDMDTDAIIARHPHVALVDELAHSNVPGSRHAKRYQDVQDLLAAGITVIATLNIQHLEGLNDIVEALTGVRQRESLPDWVLDDADEVELVDISPEALRARLRHGNVYAAARAERALAGFFTESNLTALRELALRRMAEKTETQLETLMRGQSAEGQRGGWSITATERVMVAFTGQSQSARLLRDAWRLARGLKAPLLAVTVEPTGLLARLYAPSDSERAVLQRYVRLAEDLGATILHERGGNIAATLARVAREERITQLVIGQPRSTWWIRLLTGSVVSQLLRLAPDIDIHIAARHDDGTGGTHHRGK